MKHVRLAAQDLGDGSVPPPADLRATSSYAHAECHMLRLPLGSGASEAALILTFDEMSLIGLVKTWLSFKSPHIAHYSHPGQSRTSWCHTFFQASPRSSPRFGNLTQLFFLHLFTLNCPSKVQRQLSDC